MGFGKLERILFTAGLAASLGGCAGITSLMDMGAGAYNRDLVRQYMPGASEKAVRMAARQKTFSFADGDSLLVKPVGSARFVKMSKERYLLYLRATNTTHW